MWSAPQDMPGLVGLFPGSTLAQRQTVFAAYLQVWCGVVSSFVNYRASLYIIDDSLPLQVVLANQTYWNDVLGTFMPNPWCWLGRPAC